ncbi:tail tape measure protein [Sphingomonas sp. GV3]|uniref:tail tape measure protein n=1 Tax=Sphingomonas sp. GV3 TaxID=3040671 RepID=UPI00280BA8A7|nr:tail tape measure protein [Sphingomonas sp. GV3]
MDDLETMAARVRLDTGAFAREVEAMRGTLEGTLGLGAMRAGRSIETALLRAAKQGAFGFDQLKSVALAALGEIARAAIGAGVGAATGGQAQTLGGALVSLLGLAGRATGGPVSPGQAYMVGERGPELFVPTSAGRVEPSPPAAARDIRVAITVRAEPGAAPAALQQSSRQVARAVKAALDG